MRSIRSVPWVHSATTMPRMPSSGPMPMPGVSTSITRDTPGWVKLAACIARSTRPSGPADGVGVGQVTDQ